MGIVKAISGHTGARGVMRYLERDGRALARDFLNIGAPIEGWEGDLPRYGACDWAAEMDSVREAAGNGRAWRGRAARTWKHYVLSPDPGSRVDLSTLRELAVEWASEHFPDHQVAIVYHDDNEGRIPHAHVVINNTSLETGRRLQVPDPLELNRSFQRLEAERGLPHLSNEPLARPTARARRSRGERAAEARGERSWVADIRTRADVARALAASPAEYRSLLAAMGGRARRRRQEGAQEGLGVLPRRQPLAAHPRGAPRPRLRKGVRLRRRHRRSPSHRPRRGDPRGEGGGRRGRPRGARPARRRRLHHMEAQGAQPGGARRHGRGGGEGGAPRGGGGAQARPRVRLREGPPPPEVRAAAEEPRPRRGRGGRPAPEDDTGQEPRTD